MCIGIYSTDLSLPHRKLEYFLFGWAAQLAGSQLPDQGSKPGGAVKVPSPNHWTARELPENSNFKINLIPKVFKNCPMSHIFSFSIIAFLTISVVPSIYHYTLH